MKDQIQTPYFLINESTLLNNIQEFQKALDSLWPNSIIAYSVKTNALPWLLNWMNNHGVYAEVVSDEEYQIAELAGYQGKMIVSNGPIKTEGFITRALTNGSIINIDSIYELEYIKRNRPHFTGNIGIRINIDPGVFDVSDIGYQEDGAGVATWPILYGVDEVDYYQQQWPELFKETRRYAERNKTIDKQNGG